jgi:hypothetical protein
MQLLQELELYAGAFVLGHFQVQPILAISDKLTSLTLLNAVDQRQFDLLLTHAPHLTRFKCYSIYLREDRSHAAITWKELSMVTQHSDLQMLAYLPVHSLTRSAFDRYSVQLPAECPRLHYNEFPYNLTDPSSTPEMLRRAPTNLERCPAWQQSGPIASFCLKSDTHGALPFSTIIAALPTLVSKQLHIILNTGGFEMGTSEVQVLGAVLGSRLVQLTLSRGLLRKGFWPAVWAHLPGLEQLSITNGVLQREHMCTEGLAKWDLASFCSQATHPLELRLGKSFYRSLGAAGKLPELCPSNGSAPYVAVIIGDS